MKAQYLSIGDVIIPEYEASRWVVEEIEMDLDSPLRYTALIRELNFDGTHNLEGRHKRIRYWSEKISDGVFAPSYKGSQCEIVGHMRRTFVSV